MEQDAILEGKKMFLLIAPRPEIIGTNMSAEDEALAASDALAEVDDDDDDDDAPDFDGAAPADAAPAADAAAGVAEDGVDDAPAAESDDVAKVEQATDKAEDAEA